MVMIFVAIVKILRVMEASGDISNSDNDSQSNIGAVRAVRVDGESDD